MAYALGCNLSPLCGCFFLNFQDEFSTDKIPANPIGRALIP
jgi:hypothetical protein